MIGEQPTGALQGVHITATSHEGLQVIIDGKPGRLAIVDEAGQVITSSPLVAREAQAVSQNALRNFWKCQGHLRVLSQPLGAGNTRSS